MTTLITETETYDWLPGKSSIYTHCETVSLNKPTNDVPRKWW